jgi:hypothetical protein
MCRPETAAPTAAPAAEAISRRIYWWCLDPIADHHPDHPNHHRDAEQRAEDGQDRKPEDDRRDDEQAGSHAAQQVRSVLPEVVPDGSHRSLLSSLRTLRAQAPIAIRPNPSSAGLHY